MSAIPAATESAFPNRSQQSALKNEPTPSSHSLGSGAIDRLPLNAVIGTNDLCAWQPVAGITWVQTRSPRFARKLSQRRDSRLVAWGVEGGYLRTFEFHQRLAWARRLIARYTRHDEATNEGKSAPPSPAGAFSSGESIRTAEGGS
jgi:hypothetical protein